MHLPGFRFRLRFSLFLALALCAAAPTLAEGYDRGRLDRAFRQKAGETIIPAFGVIGVEADGQEYAYYHGKTLWEGERPLGPESIFQIYSMTKPITSVAVMQLVEQGRVTLDESLEKWLPEMVAIPILQPDGRLVKSDTPITLRQLLTHTAGFAYDFVDPRLAAFKRPADWSHPDGPRMFEPGARWSYGTSIDWVGRLIEKIAGTDLEAYLRKHVTGPLGMKRTFFVVPDALHDDIVSIGEIVGGDTPRMVETKDARLGMAQPKQFSGGGGGSFGGGLFSTPRDYSRFVRMVLNGGSLDGVQVLRRETLELMVQNHIGEKDLTSIGLKDKWGLAWAIDPNGRAGGRSAGSVHWAGAANTYFSIDLRKGRAVMLFANFFPMISRHATSLFTEAEQLLYK